MDARILWPARTLAFAVALTGIAWLAAGAVEAGDAGWGGRDVQQGHRAGGVPECARCHRPGEVAPFPLLSYRDVSKRAKLISR